MTLDYFSRSYEPRKRNKREQLNISHTLGAGQQSDYLVRQTRWNITCGPINSLLGDLPLINTSQSPKVC